jgi:hypothetical protein
MRIKLPANCSNDVIFTVCIGLAIVAIISIFAYFSFGIRAGLVYAVVFGLIVFVLLILSFCVKKRKKGGAK